jgi:CXXC-20-CXXC protein
MKLPTCSHCGKAFEWKRIIASIRGAWCGVFEIIECDSCHHSNSVSNISQHLIIATAIIPYIISIIALSNMQMGLPWQYLIMMVMALFYFFLSIIISPFFIILRLNN